QPPWRPPAEPMNRGQAVPQLPRVELEPAIRDRIGDARGSVARRTARGDRVVDALRVVAADEEQRAATPDHRRIPERAARAQVSIGVLEALDPDQAGSKDTRGQLARVWEPRPGASVVAVLCQVAVGDVAPVVDLLPEWIRAAAAIRHPDGHDPHDLVPRRPPRVVRG